jgi:hypothetical protein
MKTKLRAVASASLATNYIKPEAMLGGKDVASKHKCKPV